MENQLPRPSKELTVDSLDKPLLMTYPMMNDILRFVGSLDEALNSILRSQEIRDIIIRRLLTETEESVVDVAQLLPASKVNMDIYDIEVVLGWVMDHIVYFFTKTTGRLEESITRNPKVREMMSSSPSTTGTQDSTTSKESVGPTE